MNLLKNVMTNSHLNHNAYMDTLIKKYVQYAVGGVFYCLYRVYSKYIVDFEEEGESLIDVISTKTKNILISDGIS